MKRRLSLLALVAIGVAVVWLALSVLGNHANTVIDNQRVPTINITTPTGVAHINP